MHFTRLGCSELLAAICLITAPGIDLFRSAATLRAQIAATPPIREEEGRPRVFWQNAATVVGKQALVVGKIVRVGGTSRVQFLNFAGTQRDAFKIVIFQSDLGQFPKPLADLYTDQWIEVFGHVTQYSGTPQIIVHHPQAIRILPSPPDLPAAPVPTEPERPHAPLRVATFNVKNLFDAVDDPYTEDESSPTKPRAELEAVARTLRELNADIAALQEVEDRRYLERFVEVFLPEMGYRSVVLVEGNDARGIDVALLTRYDVGPVISHRHLQFPGPEAGVRRHFSRDVLRVEVRPPHIEPLEIWLVHLKSNADGRSTAEPIRKSEVTALKQLYQHEITLHPAARILICGDFNDSYGSESLQPLFDQVSLHTLFEQVAEADRVTYTRSPYRSMIDFILASPSMKQAYVENSYRIHNLAPAQSGSDHNPVSAEFK